MKSALKHFILTYLKFALAAVLAIGSLSCPRFASMRMTDIDPSTGLFPASITIPDSSILEYKPTAISGTTLVHVRARITGAGYYGSPERQLAWSEYMTSHIQKIGSWRVSRNVTDIAVACGTENAESISLPGEIKCQFLGIEIDFWRSESDGANYRLRITRFPGAICLLLAQGTFSGSLSPIADIDKDQFRPLLNLLKKWHDQCGSTSSKCSWKKTYLVSNDYLDFAVNARAVGVVPTDSEWQHYAECTVRELARFGYSASVLTPDKELSVLVEEYRSVRGDIADKPFPSNEEHLESLAPFSAASPILKRHGVDALIFVSAKKAKVTWPTRRLYVDIALLTKSGKLGFYERYLALDQYGVWDLWASLLVWSAMTTNE